MFPTFIGILGKSLLRSRPVPSVDRMIRPSNALIEPALGLPPTCLQFQRHCWPIEHSLGTATVHCITAICTEALLDYAFYLLHNSVHCFVVIIITYR